MFMQKQKIDKEFCKEICGGFGEKDSFEKNSVSNGSTDSISALNNTSFETDIVSDGELRKQRKKYMLEYFTTYTVEAEEKLKAISAELKSRLEARGVSCD